MWRGALAAVAPGEGGAGEAGVPVPALFRLLRGSMPARRAAVVHDAFRALSGGSGSGAPGDGRGGGVALPAEAAPSPPPPSSPLQQRWPASPLPSSPRATPTCGLPSARARPSKQAGPLPPPYSIAHLPAPSALPPAPLPCAEFYSTFGIAGSGPAAVLSGATLPVPPSAGTTPSGSGGGSSAVVVPAEDWEDYFAHVSAACGDDGIFFEQVRHACRLGTTSRLIRPLHTRSPPLSSHPTPLQLVTGCFPAPQGAGAVLEPGASLAADGSVWRPSVLQAIAQLQQAAAAPGAARAAPGGSSHSGHGGSAGVRRTEHGYTYADTADPGVNVAALREHLRR